MGSPLKRILRTYALCFLVWTFLGLFFFSQSLVQRAFSGDPTPRSHYLVTWLTGVYISALLTPIVLWLARRFPIERKNWFRRSALHLLFSALFSITEIAAHTSVVFGLGLFPTIMKTALITFLLLMSLGFHQNISAYWTILGLQYGYSYYQRYREREREALRLELDASELRSQLVRAQLNALKMQLQPHFLFNTLNAIMVLVRQQNSRQAEEMIGRLSDLLRCVLEDVEAQEVPLYRELDYLRLYLSIEEVRFRDRLRVEISADAPLLQAAVPHMILQPIVENAIRHGIGKSSTAGRIQITACRVNDLLEIKVQDDGPGLVVDPESSRGIGLANTRARLDQLYGEAANLAVENGAEGGARVTLVLPFRLALGSTEDDIAELHAFDDVTG
jgi:two-component system, LytTR family, sensor kinase